MKNSEKSLIMIIVLLSITLLFILVKIVADEYSNYRQKERDTEYRENLIGVWKEDIKIFSEVKEKIFVLLPEDNDYWNGYFVDHYFETKKLHWEVYNKELTIDIINESKDKYKILYVSEKDMVIENYYYKDEITILNRTGQRNWNDVSNRIKRPY